jgi:excisionase family DNA binding protein
MSDDLIDGDDELMTTAEVAALFRVDRRTPSKWAQAGRIRSIRTPGGKVRRYRRSDIEKLLREDETDGTESGA